MYLAQRLCELEALKQLVSGDCLGCAFERQGLEARNIGDGEGERCKVISLTCLNRLIARKCVAFNRLFQTRLRLVKGEPLHNCSFFVKGSVKQIVESLKSGEIPQIAERSLFTVTKNQIDGSIVP